MIIQKTIDCKFDDVRMMFTLNGCFRGMLAGEWEIDIIRFLMMMILSITSKLDVTHLMMFMLMMFMLMMMMLPEENPVIDDDKRNRKKYFIQVIIRRFTLLLYNYNNNWPLIESSFCFLFFVFCQRWKKLSIFVENPK